MEWGDREDVAIKRGGSLERMELFFGRSYLVRGLFFVYIFFLCIFRLILKFFISVNGCKRRNFRLL